MKTVLKTLLYISLAIALFSLPLLGFGQLRDQAFRAVVELPAVYYYYRLRTPMVNRDYQIAAQYLNRQLNLVEDFADGRNTMVPGLLSNTAFVVGQAVFADEFRALRPYLERLVAAHKDLFPARLWLAEALLANEPEKVFEQADAARRMIPTDERPYRLAIAAAMKTGQTGRIAEICGQYRNATLGAYHFFDHNTLFFGAGIREFGIEIIDTQGLSSFLKHPGPKLGDDVAYQFNVDKPVVIASLRLLFATPPGLVFRIEKIRAFLGGAPTAALLRGRFDVTSRNGFETGNGIVTTARGNEVLTVHTEELRGVQADQLRINLSVSRLGFLDHATCHRKD